MTANEQNFLRDRAYLSVSLSHFFVDALNNSRSLLVAVLAKSLGLTNAHIGIVVLVYNLGSSLTQPFFGVLADRHGPRRLIVGGMAWMIVLYGVASLAGDWIALVALSMAGLGSGAVHPAGAMVASEASQSARTKATGIFFAAGQTGLFIGPIMAGFLLDIADRPGTVILPMLALSALISGWRWLSTNPIDIPDQIRKFETIKTAIPRASSRLLTSLAIILISSTTIGIATMTFAPVLFTDLEYSDSYVGWATGLFMMGSAIGGIVGGILADKFGKRFPIIVGMVGAILPIYYYIPVGDPWRFVLLPLAGFFAGMPQSVLVIIAQSLLPGRRAFASGLILGMMFFSGAVISMLVGVIADRIGLELALQWLILLPLTAIVGTLLLPDISNFDLKKR